MNRIVFFGYVVTSQSIEMDEANVRVINECPTPKYMIEVSMD
jgi:hypothetical protein